MRLYYRFNDVSFRYAGQAEELFSGLTLDFSPGWTGIIGANGAGKTTLLKLVVTELEPTSGELFLSGAAHYCPQKVDDPPAMFEDFLFSGDATAGRLISQLAIDYSWPARWRTLSAGERKRAQIGTALWHNPHILALDEPTNHIDSQCRELLRQALENFSGIGLLVSHDRELLNELCHHCLLLSPPQARLVSGGYSKAMEQEEQRKLTLAREHEKTKRELNRLRRESAARRVAVNRGRSELSKRGLSAKDHDARSKIDLARLSNKEGHAGRLLNQMQTRIAKTQEKLSQTKPGKDYRGSISFQGEQRKGDRLLEMPPGSIPMGERRLHYPYLILKPGDKVGLTGPNGSGKSTLMRNLRRRLTLPKGKLVWIAQELEPTDEAELRRWLATLPMDEKGRLLSLVSRLGSRPEQILDTPSLSPGEARKVLIAKGLLSDPWLLMLDEPTNHLDLPSIEALEQALSEVECALVLVSHDRVFLDALVNRRWHCRPESEKPGSDSRLKID